MTKLWETRKKNKKRANNIVHSHLLIPAIPISIKDLPQTLFDLKLGFLEGNNRYENLALSPYAVPETIVKPEKDAKHKFLSTKTIRIFKSSTSFFTNLQLNCKTTFDWRWQSDKRGKIGPAEIIKGNVDDDNVLTVPRMSKIIENL